jgi:hypothetical protein
MCENSLKPSKSWIISKYELKEGSDMWKGVMDCPHNEPLHYHHDGCPCCSTDVVEYVVEDEGEE